jgi:hypothetical protein
MRRWRPRLRSVVFVVLLWQLATAMLFAGPAMASVHAGTATSTDATHCHPHVHVGDTAVQTPAPGSSTPADQSGDPNCCQGMNACQCVCAQGTVAIPQILTTTPVVTDQPGKVDLRSPPLVQRTAQVFRPPI